MTCTLTLANHSAVETLNCYEEKFSVVFGLPVRTGIGEKKGKETGLTAAETRRVFVSLVPS